MSCSSNATQRVDPFTGEVITRCTGLHYIHTNNQIGWQLYVPPPPATEAELRDFEPRIGTSSHIVHCKIRPHSISNSGVCWPLRWWSGGYRSWDSRCCSSQVLACAAFFLLKLVVSQQSRAKSFTEAYCNSYTSSARHYVSIRCATLNYI